MQNALVMTQCKL